MWQRGVPQGRRSSLDGQKEPQKEPRTRHNEAMTLFPLQCCTPSPSIVCVYTRVRTQFSRDDKLLAEETSSSESAYDSWRETNILGRIPDGTVACYVGKRFIKSFVVKRWMRDRSFDLIETYYSIMLIYR